MRKYLIFLLILIYISTYGQLNEEKTLYVVDSIQIINDPGEEEGTISETDIETLNIITDKSEITKYGYKDYDKIIFIITKEYVKRPEELKKIPTVKQMERRNGKWYLKGSEIPYSGKFIDYYFNGKKKGDGIFNNGIVEGLRTVYYQDGTISYYRNYVNGIENGESKEYFPNGKIHQEGAFLNGKDDGLWKEWYSTGQLKRQTEFKEGKVLPTKAEEKFHKLLTSGIEMLRAENYQGALKAFDKAIALNPNYSDAYFYKGSANLYDFNFDEAIKDFDKAVDLEPLYKEAYSNRAFARLRKHEFKNSRTLSKGNGITVMASKDKIEIPKQELDLICADLNMGLQLGDNKKSIIDAIEKYCK